MKIVLTPHALPYFGQDFTSVLLAKKIGLHPVYLKNGEYDFSKIDITSVKLIVSRYPDLSSDLSVIRKYSKRIPIVIHIHLNYSFFNQHQKNTFENSILYACLLVTNCKMLRNYYRNIFPKFKWTYINNGIDSNIFKPTTKLAREKFRKKNGIPKNRILISYTGRLNNSKGLQILRKIFDFTSTSKKFFFIIQSIPLPKYDCVFSEIQSKYSNLKIILTQREKVVKFCDVHISTSLSETTSLVTLEALFCGVQVICTDVSKFYNEIDNKIPGIKYFRKVKMRASINNKATLNLQTNYLNDIGSDFIKEIDNTILLKQKQRMYLGNSFAKTEFESAIMVEKIRRLYDIAVLKK